MRAVLQRVQRAVVSKDGEILGKIGQGWVVLLGVAAEDDMKDADYLAEKVSSLRAFADTDGKMNLSVLDVAGEVLVVSQFTLLADCRKGRRPGYSDAAKPEQANQLYEAFVENLRKLCPRVQTGRFQADMQVELCNDGPVTLLLDSRKTF